jgi:hypothetical protein
LYKKLKNRGKQEKAWRKWFAEFYTWIMADGFNKVMKVDE